MLLHIHLQELCVQKTHWLVTSFIVNMPLKVSALSHLNVPCRPIQFSFNSIQIDKVKYVKEDTLSDLRHAFCLGGEGGGGCNILLIVNLV